MFLVPSFWNGNFYSMSLYPGFMYLVCNFTGAHSEAFALSLRRDFEFGCLDNVGALMDLEEF